MSTHPPSPSPEHPILRGAVAALHPPDTSPLPVGTRIGGDVVEGVLGRGGFATVYRVRGPSGYVSALKVLPLDEGPERAERAWREMSLGTRLSHPNLVRQLGAGQWPLENPRYLWVKLELVEGPTLDAWGLAPGRTGGEVMDRVLEVARALAVSHEAGVIHRDVKEANILVRQKTGEAVLVDFGVGWHPAYPTLTKGMFPPGTPAYRAPEAWAYGRAHAGEPGAHYRAGVGDDLYALGVVLYRLLTGRFPFRPAEHGGEDVDAVLHREPLPPHLVNPRVPLEVEAVCLRLLAKTPAERYPSAVALYEALEAAKARADATWKVPLRERPRGASPWRSRGARVLVGLGVGLALALGVWWLASRQEVAPPRPPPQPSSAVAPPAAPRKDSAPVKPQQTPSPPPDMRSSEPGSLLHKLCLGLYGSALQACIAAHSPLPPERPTPPPQECPARAVETMMALGLRLGDMDSVYWYEKRGRSGAFPVREDTPVFVAGDWDTPTGKTALPDSTRLSGRLYFGEKRVYGRFTEARTPSGETYPVCLELWDDEQLGALIEPESTPGKPMVSPSADVRVVDRFR